VPLCASRWPEDAPHLGHFDLAEFDTPEDLVAETLESQELGDGIHSVTVVSLLTYPRRTPGAGTGENGDELTT